MHTKLLIVGAPRSGFGYTAFLLSHVFHKQIGHERWDHDGIAAFWLLDRTDTPKYQRYIADSTPTFVHQVRNPIKSISSMVSRVTKYRHQIPTVLPTDTPAEAAAKWWLHTNTQAETAATLTYRLEALLDKDTQDPDHPIHWYLRYYTDQEVALQRFLRTKTKPINKATPKKPTLGWSTWEQLEQAITPDTYLQVQHKAVQYGYALTGVSGRKLQLPQR